MIMTQDERNKLIGLGYKNIILDENNLPNWKEDFKDPCYIFNLEEQKRYLIDSWVIKKY